MEGMYRSGLMYMTRRGIGQERDLAGGSLSVQMRPLLQMPMQITMAFSI